MLANLTSSSAAAAIEQRPHTVVDEESDDDGECFDLMADHRQNASTFSPASSFLLLQEAKALLDREDVESQQRGLDVLKRVHERKDSEEASLLLAVCLARGFGMPANPGQAEQVLAELVDLRGGSIEAQFQLAKVMQEQHPSCLEKQCRIFKLAQAAAFGHHKEALRLEGNCWADGYGTSKDLVRAEQCYLGAQDGAALLRLASQYEGNIEKIMQLYMNAAPSCPEAKYRLAKLLLRSKPKRARNLLRVAAKEGVVNAKKLLRIIRELKKKEEEETMENIASPPLSPPAGYWSDDEDEEEEEEEEEEGNGVTHHQDQEDDSTYWLAELRRQSQSSTKSRPTSYVNAVWEFNKGFRFCPIWQAYEQKDSAELEATYLKFLDHRFQKSIMRGGKLRCVVWAGDDAFVEKSEGKERPVRRRVEY